MADNDIKIRVTQESHGTALKDAKRDAEELQRAAKAKELESLRAHSAGDTKRAATLEKEASVMHTQVRLMREYNLGRAEALRLAQTEAALDARRGHGGSMGSARLIGDALDMATGSQGWVMRAQAAKNLPHMLSALMRNPAALPVLAAAAYVGYKGVRIGQEDQEIAIQQDLAEKRGSAERKLERTRRYGHDSGSVFAEELGMREEIAKRAVHRQALMDEAHSGLFGRLDKWAGTEFFTKGKGWFKPESARKLDAHDREIGPLQPQKAALQRASAEFRMRTVRPALERPWRAIVAICDFIRAGLSVGIEP